MLNHIRRGEGPPVLLIHGLGSRLDVWDLVTNRLSARREVIAVDLPGFGASAPLPPTERPDPSGLARAVEAFLDELRIESPVCVGNSLGGAVARELGRTGRVSSVIASAPACFTSGWDRRYLATQLRANRVLANTLRGPLRRIVARPPLRNVLFRSVVAKPGSLDAAAARASLDGVREATDYDRTRSELLAYRLERPDEIQVPVTIVWGEHDRLTLLRGLDRATRAIPTARGVTMTGVGHLPMVEDPDRLTGLILAD